MNNIVCKTQVWCLLCKFHDFLELNSECQTDELTFNLQRRQDGGLIPIFLPGKAAASSAACWCYAASPGVEGGGG